MFFLYNSKNKNKLGNGAEMSDAEMSGAEFSSAESAAPNRRRRNGGVEMAFPLHFSAISVSVEYFDPLTTSFLAFFLELLLPIRPFIVFHDLRFSYFMPNRGVSIIRFFGIFNGFITYIFESVVRLL